MRPTKAAGAAAKAAALLAALPAALMLALAAPAAAAPSPGDGIQSFLGNDVSWPQCSAALPEGQAFGIVGVNNGRANTTNPCLAGQLAWASSSSGAAAGQPPVSLYVNTANPGAVGSWWPASNVYPELEDGIPVQNPYGECTQGRYGAACAYMYGYAKAWDDAYIRGVSDPSGYFWWLDVETGNSWSGTDKEANRAVLEGMTAFFRSIRVEGVGIYSSSRQWERIVGTVPPWSNLYSLPSWLAGALSAAGAKANCSDAPLTAGGRVALTQFVSRGFDYNYSCLRAGEPPA